MRICVFEDSGVKNLHPLTLPRPAFALRCGAVSLLERQERCLPEKVTAALIRSELIDLIRPDYPHWQFDPATAFANVPEDELVLLVNARWLAPAVRLPRPQRAELGLVGEQIVYIAVPARQASDLSLASLPWRLKEWQHALPVCPAGGWMIDYLWDLLEHNGTVLKEDYRQWRQHGVPAVRGELVHGPTARCLAADTAEIEPMVYIDTTAGPVLIDEGAVVQAFSRLQGPCYIGKQTRLCSAHIQGSSIGPECRIGGEVEASIVQGYSNKAHEGFLGHSYLGEWVNLAAGTHTSDLRTDYGTIPMTVAGHTVKTGLLKLGSFIGDHSKTSLNTLFNTGSQIGVFGQLLGGGQLLPRVIPSFCRYGHHRLRERTNLREMFDTAATMMARRGQQWQDVHAEFFISLLEETSAERHSLLREFEQGQLRRVV